MLIAAQILGSDITRNIIGTIAGFTAFFIYQLNKKDGKKKAAKILYIEIQDIESNVAQVKKSQGKYRTDIPVFSTNNWNEHKSSFVNFFNRAEYESVNSFYLLLRRSRRNAKHSKI